MLSQCLLNTRVNPALSAVIYEGNLFKIQTGGTHIFKKSEMLAVPLVILQITQTLQISFKILFTTKFHWILFQVLLSMEA